MFQDVAGLRGFVLDWFVYSSPKKSEKKTSESEIVTSPMHSPERWKYFHIVNDYAIDLALVPGERNGIAYAACFMWSDRKQNVMVEVGAYDGYKLWLNDHLLADFWSSVEPKFRDNMFRVILKEKANLFVLEMDRLKRQLYCLRLFSPREKPLKGIYISTSCMDKTSPALSRVDEDRQLEFPYYSAFYYFNMIMDKEPLMRFHGKNRCDWLNWRRRFRSKLIEMMGEFPNRCPLNPKILERTDMGEYIREKVVFQSEPRVWVPSYVLIPKKIDRKSGTRALLCIHGHGRGKDDPAGVDNGDPSLRRHISDLNYNYAAQYALNGYVTITPDLRYFGERVDPAYARSTGKGDPCVTNFYRAMVMGQNLVTSNVWDLIRALDYLSSRPEVDRERIGCVGLSLGGRMTMYLSAIDERVKAAILSSIINCFKERLLPNAGGCGGQYVPGLLKYGDVHEICSLMAPRPLLFEFGIYDTLCPAVYANDIFDRVRKAYKVAEAEDKLDIDIFLGAHRFNGMKALSWFDRWL